MAIDPVSALITGGMGLLGSMAGAQGGGSTTQTVQYLPPQYSPQQQAINNIMYYGIMQNLAQQQPQYQNLLNQYIYGMPGGGMGTTGGLTMAGGLPTAQQAIEQYRAQKEMVAQAEQPYKEQQRDIKIELLAPVYAAAQAAAKGRQDPAQSSDYKKAVATAKEELGAVAGMNANDVDAWIEATKQKGITDQVQPAGFSDRRYLDKYAKTPTSMKVTDPQQFKNIQNTLQGTDFSQVTRGITQPTPAAETAGAAVQPAGATQPVTSVEAGAQPGGILGQLMQSPQYLAEQFGLAKEQGMKGISDWYQQAQREMEQRGIGQGGYLGSQYERDVGGILGKRGEMETNLGSSLRQAEIAATQQNWYDMLNALSGLQTQQGNLQYQQQAPWLGAAQQMTNVQPGYTTTGTSPGAGIIPGALGGLALGSQLAGMGQNLGFWGQQSQPATAYGAGTTGGLSLAGTQNLYNQYIANPWG